MERKFQHRFSGLGMSYYTSDSVIGELNTIFMSGTVTVALPGETELNVVAKAGEIEAKDSDITLRARSITAIRSACPDASTSCTASPAGNLTFKASPCLTPTVAKINVTEGATSTGMGCLEGNAASTLEIQGSGFGDLCQTKVMIGSTHLLT